MGGRYVVVKLGGRRVHKTPVKKKTLNPIWNDKFVVGVTSMEESIVLEAYDQVCLAAMAHGVWHMAYGVEAHSAWPIVWPIVYGL